MARSPHRASRLYAAVQTVLLCVFAGAFFLDTGRRLFPPGGIPGTLGALLCGLGVVLLLSAFASIGGAIQIAPEPRPGAQLVTRGAYRYLRHPIYTAIMILGLSLRKPTACIGIGAVLVIVFLVAKARFEETLLLARYADYAGYRDRTWGIVPWPRRPPKDR